jgi:molybdenum cofactor sulfurtransferase
MQALKHSNDQPLVKIYGPRDSERRGGTIAFNLCDANGKKFNCGWVQDLASKARISLRTGCFCNPGDGEVTHNVTKDRMADCFEGTSPDREGICKVIRDDEMASIRVSVGLVSNFPDVYRFMHFASCFKDKGAKEIHSIGISRTIRDRGP